jgi:hypothetical protein
MKTLIAVVLLALPLAFATAQDEPARMKHGRAKRADATEAAQAPAPESKPGDAKAADAKAADPKVVAPRFVDENGDGVDDRKAATAGQGKGAACGKDGNGTRKRDCFIDRDGDGINDNRCGGLGPRMRRQQAGAAK